MLSLNQFYESLEPDSNLNNRGKNELEIFVKMH